MGLTMTTTADNVLARIVPGWASMTGARATLPPGRESRATLKNPEAWLLEAFGATPTGAGVSMGPSNADTIPTVYACVRVIAESIAALPLEVKQREPGGAARLATEHPLWGLLTDQPNPEMSAITLVDTLLSWVLLWGNGVAEVVRDAAGIPRSIWPMMTTEVQPTRLPRTRELVYQWTPTVVADGGRVNTRRLLRRSVFHVPGYTRNGTWGMSPVALCRESLGLTKAAEVFGASFFGNGAKPGGVLTHPDTFSDEAVAKRVRASWEDAHSGPNKAHRVAVLEEGMTYTSVGVPPEDAQFLQTRAFQVPELCRLYRVPPHMVQDLSKATNNNIEQQGVDFVRYTLLPWVRRFEAEADRKLLTPQERAAGYMVRFNLDVLLRADTKARAEYLTKMRTVGYLNVDDGRAIEGLPPVPDGRGKVYMAQAGLVPMPTPDQADALVEAMVASKAGVGGTPGGSSGAGGDGGAGGDPAPDDQLPPTD